MEEYKYEMVSGDIVIRPRFSSDEKNELRRTLKGVAPPGAIEAFIAGAEVLCEGKKDILMRLPAPAEARTARGEILSSCRRALKTLNRYTLDPLKGTYWDLIYDITQDAITLSGNLERFIEKLENFHRSENKKIKRKGRPRADNDDFIKFICALYERYLGPATLYEDGHFFQVIRLLLSFVGLPSEYPTKSIRAAIKGTEAIRDSAIISVAGLEAEAKFIEQTQGIKYSQDKDAVLVAIITRVNTYLEQRGYHISRIYKGEKGFVVEAEQRMEQKKQDLLTLKKEPTE